MAFIVILVIYNCENITILFVLECIFYNWGWVVCDLIQDKYMWCSFGAKQFDTLSDKFISELCK